MCECVFGPDRGEAKTYSSWQVKVGQSISLFVCLFFGEDFIPTFPVCKSIFEHGSLEELVEMGFIIVEHISNGCHSSDIIVTNS